jgi:predicted MFS family arabinose efflux permease
VAIGPLGDRMGKLRVLAWAMAAFAVATGACALAGGVASLAALRVAAGAASAAIIPVGMAYIADGVPYADRQVTLSRFLNGIVLSQLLAGPIGGVVGEYIGWRGVFVALAAGGIVVVAAFARRGRRHPDRRTETPAFSMANYVRLMRHGGARRILFCGMLDGMLLMGSFPFLAPYMHAAFGLSYAEVGLVLAAFGAGALAYTRSARLLVPVLGERGCAMAGGALMAVAVSGAVAAPHWAVFVPVELALGLGFYLLHGVMQARATELLPQARATAVSSFAFVLFLGQSIGALGMGGLIAHFGYTAAFLADAGGIAVFTLYLGAVLRRTAA